MKKQNLNGVILSLNRKKKGEYFFSCYVCRIKINKSLCNQRNIKKKKKKEKLQRIKYTRESKQNIAKIVWNYSFQTKK